MKGHLSWQPQQQALTMALKAASSKKQKQQARNRNRNLLVSPPPAAPPAPATLKNNYASKRKNANTGAPWPPSPPSTAATCCTRPFDSKYFEHIVCHDQIGLLFFVKAIIAYFTKVFKNKINNNTSIFNTGYEKIIDFSNNSIKNNLNRLFSVYHSLSLEKISFVGF